MFADIFKLYLSVKRKPGHVYVASGSEMQTSDKMNDTIVIQYDLLC